MVAIGSLLHLLSLLHLFSLLQGHLFSLLQGHLLSPNLYHTAGEARDVSCDRGRRAGATSWAWC